jgi:tetratricopeptide (TPR) repeat protein
MALDLRAYRVFLSSPTGLEPERDAFYRTIQEVNESEAEARKRSFIPVGWDREPAGWGEPQKAHFNPRLKLCDYLVMILADRWGTPTGNDETGFSSGTEEEYNVARECLLSNEPMRDIVVLFRAVPERQLIDPGPQLSQVLAFKEALEQEKSLYFSTFDSEAELTRILRRILFRWLRDDDQDSFALGDGNRGSPPPSPSSPQETKKPSAAPAAETPLEEAQDLASSGKGSKAEERFAEAVSAEDGDDLEARFQYTLFLRRSGRLTHAIELSKELIAFARARDEDVWAIKAFGNLGVSQRRAGHVEDSRASLAKGIALAGDDHQDIVGYLENNLGLTLRRAGEIGQAEGHYNRALRIYEEIGDNEGLAYAHVNLSYVIRELGDLEQARKHAEIVLGIDESSKRCLAMAHCNLGLIAEAEEDLDTAEHCFELALKLNSEIDNAPGMGMNHAHLARVRLERKDERAALKNAGHALELNEWSGYNEGIAMSLHVIGRIEMRQGKFSLAESRLKDARDIYVALEHRIALAETMADIGILMARTRRLDDAEDALHKARESGEHVEHVGLKNRLKHATDEVARLREAASNGT